MSLRLQYRVLAMDRNIWTEHITQYSCPKWPCRFCVTGHLLLDKESLRFEETVGSQAEHKHEAWEPDWTDYCFSAWATCSNIDCKQRYVLSGNGSIAQVFDENGDDELITFFTPKHCYPMPDIFCISKQCPNEVSKSLRESFTLYYSDKNSCAGKIRCALEKLMDHVGVPAFKDALEKKTRISLHDRLEKFKSHEPQIASNLLAIKWLGNTAIHETAAILEYDILDAYEIIEHELKEILDQPAARISKLAQKLEYKHKPQK